MRYLLMCYFNENKWNTLELAQRDQIMKDYHHLIQQTIERGQHCDGAMLRPITTATVVRVQNGKVAITDGPFAETKEQLGGYHLMEFENLDEAISMASRIPTLPFGGTIEIRPVEKMER